jgi:hypothetical protein
MARNVVTPILLILATRINNMNRKNNNRRILLVIDDEPDITLTFSMGLEDNGFVVDAYKIE